MNFKTKMISHELISGFGFGLFLAIQGLFFIEKGVEVWQIGILFGVIAVSASVFEIPFGAVADIYGRIKIYKISRMIFMLAAALAIFTSSFWVLVITMLLMGLSKALDSGTIDSWYAEQILASDDKDKLQSFVSTFQASMALGMTIGAISGGYIPQYFPQTSLFPATSWNLVIILIVIAVHLGIMPFLFREGDKTTPSNSAVGNQMRQAIKYCLNNSTIKELLTLGVFLGIGIATIDAYWQIQLLSIHKSTIYTMLGWVTAGYFAMAIIGPMLVGVVAEATKAAPILQIRILIILLAASVLLLTLQTTTTFFIMAYLGFMLVFSMINSPAFTLLNIEASNQFRSTIQSISSLAFTIGGGVSAFVFSLIIKSTSVEFVWFIVAALMFAYGVINPIISYAKRP